MINQIILKNNYLISIKLFVFFFFTVLYINNILLYLYFILKNYVLNLKKKNVILYVIPFI